MQRRKFIALAIGAMATRPLAARALTAEEAQSVALEAYIYFYPLVIMDVTRKHFTNIEADKKFGRVTISPLNHGSERETALAVIRSRPGATLSPWSARRRPPRDSKWRDPPDRLPPEASRRFCVRAALPRSRGALPKNERKAARPRLGWA